MKARQSLFLLFIILSCQKIKFKTDVFTFSSPSIGDKEVILKSHEEWLFTFTYQNEPCYLNRVGEDSVYGLWKFDETVGDIFDTKRAYSLAGRVYKEPGSLLRPQIPRKLWKHRQPKRYP